MPEYVPVAETLLRGQMGSESHQLHIFFFPFMAPGHMIPMIDMAKLFAIRGCKSTLIATPHDEPTFSKSIAKPKDSGFDIDVITVTLPLKEVGLPEDCDNMNKVTTGEMRTQFMRAIMMLDQQFELLIEKHAPNCLISDIFLPWTTEIAAKCGIPRLVFHGTSAFSIAGSECVRLFEPHKKVSCDSEPFVIPNFPGEITLSRMQLPDFVREETDFSKFCIKVKESEKRSFGVVMNSFYELEPAYADHYRTFLGRRSWFVGPLSLCNKENEDKAHRGNQASIDQHECLKWLDSKQPNSVIYICFGSMANFNASQLHEIAVGLEASKQQFIWVVKKDPNVEEGKEEWLPDGYESRIRNKGLIIRGWAPQVLILDHEAIGGFVTHCGWNSTLEAVTAGVPMVTWPVAAEQFFNEKFVTQVLKIGIDIGVKQWVRLFGDSVKSERVEEAVKRVLVGEEAEEMRRRAKALAEMARGAVEEGGSSWSDLGALLQELRLHRSAQNKKI
ncbi:scopoletin glucosyltransferase-like [Syzygium oleosum]|uniref:scopoletin glucosyltransferase-like n=1 Tax=Syzygium oleosum TaxID=219896 RepID=UPI0024B8B8A0|nr:scopoletin glucosyltransferase-like [Syzygium oleosum]